MGTVAKLVVLSGPSGVGKSTVLRRLVERYPDQLRLSVSATTRPPRPGETDGVDYYFLDRRRSSSGAGRRGNSSNASRFSAAGTGTARCSPRSAPSPDDPRSVILDVDVAGADQVRRLFPGCPRFFSGPAPSRSSSGGCGPAAPNRKRRSSAAWKSPAASWPGRANTNFKSSTTRSTTP